MLTENGIPKVVVVVLRTSNLSPGELVPIPTLAALSMRMRSIELVANANAPLAPEAPGALIVCPVLFEPPTAKDENRNDLAAIDEPARKYSELSFGL
jgi:hypothetical protein